MPKSNWIPAVYPLRILLLGLVLVVAAGCANSGPNVPSQLWYTYKEYLTQPHYRAMACVEGSEQVGCNRTWQNASAKSAADRSLEGCNEAQVTKSERIPCSLRFVGDTNVSGMKKSQVAQVIEQYQEDVIATKGALPGKPSTTDGLAGVTFLDITFTTEVQNAKPVDDLTSIPLSQEYFYIHAKWALDMDRVKQFIVRYEVFDGQSKLVSNSLKFYVPKSTRWNTWRQIKLTKFNQPGQWQIAIYISIGPGETKMADKYLTVLPD